MTARPHPHALAWIRPFVGALCVLAALLSTGCSVQRLYAPTAVLADVHVKIYDARIGGDDHVYVKMMVRNNTDVPVELDRDGISLRLPNGDIILRRKVPVTEPRAEKDGQIEL